MGDASAHMKCALRHIQRALIALWILSLAGISAEKDDAMTEIGLLAWLYKYRKLTLADYRVGL